MEEDRGNPVAKTSAKTGCGVRRYVECSTIAGIQKTGFVYGVSQPSAEITAST